MPELPDLNVFAKNIDKELAGKKVEEIDIKNKSKLKVPVSELKKEIEGSKLKKVYREGKELHYEFSNGNILGMHLMLHGGLEILDGKNDKKNTIVEIHFEKDKILVLTDYQGAANIALNPELKDAPDALSEEVDYKFLKEKLSKKKTTIKAFFLDQKNIRGIGNAYADEILWESKIHPESKCNKIPDEKVKALTKNIRSVLKDAEKQILKINPDIISGEERSFLKIHNSKKKESPGGAKIHNKMVNSRITYYTDEQELYE
ncbi:MAG TPA: DNA-formamidopyrimidine glycosylase family protein [Flavisolibacter sp.]|jgi:formamidopyrimidine-DNA glycosylase|nr:DNA-formamidopyrimidine glycosylase family protein [Flavisolibacter sp.]